MSSSEAAAAVANSLCVKPEKNTMKVGRVLGPENCGCLLFAARRPEVSERNNQMLRHQYRDRIDASATKLLVRLTLAVILWVGSVVCVRAQDTQPNKSDESWTAAKQTSIDHANPSRTLESHSKSDDRSMDKQRVEVLGSDGRYQPYYDTETETFQVNASTTRTVVREYRWDSNGRRNLLQVTEQESQSLSNGDTRVVSTTSSADVNGSLHFQQREVADIKKTSPDVQETRTTVYLNDGTGSFTPSQQTREVQTSRADHSVEVKKTTLLPGANGNWQVFEVKEKTIKDEDAEHRTTEERVSRSDVDGRVAEVSRTVGQENQTADGVKSVTIETYTPNVPGVAGDGKLHLTERGTSMQNRDADNKTSEQQIQQPKPGNPTDGLQVRAKTKYTVHYAANGTQQTKTIQTRDANGNFSVISVETEKSDQVPAQPVQKAPPDKSK